MFINAISSGATGLALVLIPNVFLTLFEVADAWPFVATGIFLVAFALMVFIEARKTIVNPSWVRIIIILDAMWVVASIAVITLQSWRISSLGYALIGAVALWVGLMAYLQYMALKKLVIAR